MGLPKYTERFLLAAGLMLCLLQVWLPAYYLTGDGPCHLYNAQVVHDLWCNRNYSFYTHFYNLAYRPDPNWLSTFALALLLFLFKGAVAEKVFLTIYVLLYVGGFKLLLGKISNGRSLWVLAVFILVFPHVLAKGFYNFSFSLAFYSWMVWSWLRFIENRKIAAAGLFFLFAGLLFFTHLLSFGFGAFTCAALALSWTIAQHRALSARAIFRRCLAQLGMLTLLLAPFMLLMVLFTQREGGLQLTLGHHFYRLLELAQFKYLISVTHTEDVFAVIAGITLLLLFCLLLYKCRQGISIHQYDGFFISLLFAVFVYLFFPESFLGRLLLIAMRVQPMVIMLMLCCLAYRYPAQKIQDAAALVLFACFVALCVCRTSVMLTASRAVQHIAGAGSFIKPNSVVLPLGFAPAGIDERGKVITDANWTFVHAAQYIGTQKPLIILDNYEANMGYFPIRWNEQVNPYYSLSRDEGIEGLPPYADIEGYKRTSGVTIDYILMWCYSPAFLSNKDFSMLYGEISKGYHMVYSAEHNRVLLWQRNN